MKFHCECFLFQLYFLTTIFCRFFSSFSDGENDYVALKDLSFDGYDTVQRDLGITQEKASFFLKLLANFHALSIAARQQNSEFEEVARTLKVGCVY